jgi:hypothetical protein
LKCELDVAFKIAVRRLDVSHSKDTKAVCLKHRSRSRTLCRVCGAFRAAFLRLLFQ